MREIVDDLDPLEARQLTGIEFDLRRLGNRRR